MHVVTTLGSGGITIRNAAIEMVIDGGRITSLYDKVLE